MIKGLIFDLDGVIVDTAKYHYLAWKALADEMNIPFSEKDNEHLKGVSRTRSLEILLEMGGLELDNEKKEAFCNWKNVKYLTYINALRKEEVLPGAKRILKNARTMGYRTALGSASKNARLILEKLEILDLFDKIIDGTQVSAAKPDPEVFIRGAEALGLDNIECLVFEDAAAGVQAAHNADMKVVGIGSKAQLPEADYIIVGFQDILLDSLICQVEDQDHRNIIL